MLVRKCHDCGVEPGSLHERGCDVERCALCGGQLIGCDCVYWMSDIDPATLEEEHAEIYHGGPTSSMERHYDGCVECVGGRLPWTGEFPGSAECREFGWYSRMVPGRGWVRCEASHPDAGEDLNRLHSDATWDPRLRRFVRRSFAH